MTYYAGTLLSGNYLKRFNWLESTESRFCRATVRGAKVGAVRRWRSDA